MKAKRTNIIKKQGTKTLAGILAVCMTLGTPISVLADDNTSDSTMEQQAGVQNVLAKKVDGSETLVKVSEVVLGMIQRNEVKLDTDKFLKDVTTGQKVDPTTGERVTELGTPVEPSEPEIPTTPTEPSEPSEPEIPETPAEPSEPNEPATPNEPNEPETPADNIENTETDQNGQADQEEAVQTENTEASNENLISRQQIVKLPQIIDDFRFWTVARIYAFAKEDLYVRESIPEGIDGTADTSDESLKADKKAAKKEAKKLNAIYEKAEQNKKAAIHAELITEQQQTEDDVTLNENVTDQNAEQVRYIGKLDKNGLLYILKEEENGWLYVESGNVRGFVKASEVYTSNAAQKLLEVYQKEAKKTAAENGAEYTGIEGTAAIAQTLVSPLENQAYTYLRATVNQTVADKNYATVNATMLNVRESKGTESRIVGTMNRGALCYVLADADSDWVYVESADVRGFVARQYLNTGDEVTKQVEITGEDHYQTAEEIISPEENQALYYTLTSTKEGTPNGAVRESILEYASQFIGNPYVFTSDKYKEPLLFVTPATIDNAVRPQNPACPNTFPTTIPRIAPIKNLDNSNVPPLFRTAGISFNCNVVPRQNNCSPIHVAAPALENAAVVNPPISNACGNNVCMTAPISNGTSINPAGTFCKNFIIIVKSSYTSIHFLFLMLYTLKYTSYFVNACSTKIQKQCFFTNLLIFFCALLLYYLYIIMFEFIFNLFFCLISHHVYITFFICHSGQ